MISTAIFQEKTKTKTLTNLSKVTQQLSEGPGTQTQAISSETQAWFNHDVLLIILSRN